MHDVQMGYIGPSQATFVAAYSAGKILLVRRGTSWGFPGGNITRIEPLGVGARRKLFEETGVRVDESLLEKLVTIQKREDHELVLFGAILPDGAFDHLGAHGPRGHEIMKCDVHELADIKLRPWHRTLLYRLTQEKQEYST